MSRFSTKPQFGSPSSSPRPYTPASPIQHLSTSPSTTPKPPTNPLNSSNVDYTHLPPSLLHTLRSSFLYIDKDSDGTISSSDLTATLASLSQATSASNLQAYFKAAPSPLNLASYLTHLSGYIGELASEDELLTALEAFDDGDDGTVDVGELREALMNTGEVSERMTEAEVERALRGFVRKRGLRSKGSGGDRFAYREWVGSVCGKGDDEED
ncbi:EF-hand [Terfezia boudieri ATCC MYA-4762]|uniref:EF-hand n=1 Tax=Terfezia boudieri ATCC MYA-4762 TaxID=1051890 RepID=A0A3N4M2W8_9PEZI|nr:EF-hand [Terfezia boudieri ATCC MYA-4762]